MSKKNAGKKQVKKPHWLGRLMLLLPVSCALFYPLFLATQLDLVTDTYTSASLPAVFDGLKVAYLSDIHYGTYFSEQRVAALVEKVNALSPDLIILGGDYGEDAQGALQFFRLRPAFHANIATLAVMGNHDRTAPESTFSEITKAMIQAGIRPLVNDIMVLEKEGKRLAIASIDDMYNGFPELESVADRCRGCDFVIFAPHSPDILPQAYELPGGPFYQLALCGHTHGGQIAPFGYAIKSSSIFGNRYRSGWKQEMGTDLMVSNGVGTSWFPIRIGARPQYHLITLRSAE